MSTMFSQFERLAQFLAPLLPQVRLDKKEVNKENSEKIAEYLIFLLDALFKAEILTRKKHFSLPEGRRFFSAELTQVLPNIGLFLQLFNTQVLGLSRTERQTFSFILENVQDYFQHLALPDEKDRKTLFVDYRFWLENFFKIFDQKISGAFTLNRKTSLINIFSAASGQSELVYTNPAAVFDLFPFLISRNNQSYFLVDLGEREPLYRDVFTGEELHLGSAEIDGRAAELLVANFAFSELEKVGPRLKGGASPLAPDKIELFSLAFRLYNERNFQDSFDLLNTVAVEDFDLPLLYLLQVKNLIYLNRVFEAKRLLQKFLIHYAHYSEAHELMGDICSREENHEMAVGCYEKAASINQSKSLGEKLKKSRELLDKSKGKPDTQKNELYFDISADAAQCDSRLLPRRKELRQMVEILISASRRNVLLVGDRGVGKSALVRLLAQKILLGEVPAVLREKHLKEINFVGLLTGSKYRGQFEEKVLKFFQEFRQENSILVIEDIHLTMSSGAARGTSLDLVNILKPFLRENSIQVIATTDYEELKNTVEKDNSLLAHFQKITVPEMSLEESEMVLQALVSSSEYHNRLTCPPLILREVVENAKKSIKERKLPDSAILVFERSAAKASLRNENEGMSVQVREEDVVEVLADLLNLPESKISLRWKNRLAGLKEKLLQRICGQDAALETMVASIVTSKLGYDLKKNRPNGVFLFVGPTGVGKTETALALSEALYGSEDYLIRIDMSEYMEKFTYSRFVGAAPGYVGYYDSNQLTDKVRQNPFSIILLDEIEKADSQLMNIFLQVFDAGRLTDARGNVVDFSKSTIIMTSNVGTSLFSRSQPGFNTMQDGSDVSRAALIKSLKRFFSPEFLNRVDEIIVFNHLTPAAIRRIIDIHLAVVRKDLEKEGKELVIRPEVIDWIAARGYSSEYGARNLARVIKSDLLEKIAALALDQEWEDARVVSASCGADGVVVQFEGAHPAVDPGRMLEDHRSL